ncbi:MAG: hypothetical protein K0U61_01600 [Alphaproteobacteria bacterium]|nr:hypothetical protein [Alphaproteobacteria bacterium]
MTKAERIRTLFKKGLSDKQIAEKVGCLTAYVRAVRRRINGSPVDQRYDRKIRSRGDKDAASRAGKRARLAAKRAGLSVLDRHRAQNRARDRVIRKTGRAALRKEAAHA